MGAQSPAAAALAVEAVRRLMGEIEAPTRLRDVGLKEGAIPDLAKSTMGVTRVLRTNPRICTEPALEQLLRRAW